MDKIKPVIWVAAVSIALFVINTVWASPQQYAKKQRTQGSYERCITRFLDCFDSCDYHQEVHKIQPCKDYCKKRFPCRVKSTRRRQG